MMLLDEADLDALVARAQQGTDAREIEAVVAELKLRRRSESRRDIMMMAAAISSEAISTYDGGLERKANREHVAGLAVAMAFEIEKATPK